MTVKQLKESIDDDELVYWMAYDRLDPIGGYRMDANFAQLAMIQAGDKDSKLSDFLIFNPDPISEEEADRRQAEKDRQSRIDHAERMKKQIAKMLEKQSKNSVVD